MTTDVALVVTPTMGGGRAHSLSLPVSPNVFEDFRDMAIALASRPDEFRKAAAEALHDVMLDAAMDWLRETQRRIDARQPVLPEVTP